MKIFIWLLFSGVSAILYRIGGMSKDDTAEPKWIPKFMRKSWVRDWIIPFVSLGYLLTLWQPQSVKGWLLFLPCIALNGGALSTYWDEFFGYDNYWFHGLMCGLALSPLCWAGLPYVNILFRALACAVGMGLWSKIIGNDVAEEMGRGFIHTATVLLLII